MNILEWISDIIKNLFSVAGDGWIIRNSNSHQDLESCNGVASEDEITNTCALCVALNRTIFRNNNKPNYYHFHCKCTNQPRNLSNVKVIFDMRKIKDYLLVKVDKANMIKTMGYYLEDAEELFNLIETTVREEFKKGNYVLKELNTKGQHFQKL